MHGVRSWYLIATLLAQAPSFEAHPNDPLHLRATLECGGEGRTVEWVADFEGALHVWVTTGGGSVRLEARTSGAEAVGDGVLVGGVSWLRIDVVPDARVELRLTSAEGSGPLELHLISAPETAATRAAWEASDERRRKLDELRRSGDLAAARAGAREWIEALLADESIGQADSGGGALTRAAFVAYQLGEITAARSAWERALAHRERVHPPHHPRVLILRKNVAAALEEQGDLEGARAMLESSLAGALAACPAETELILGIEQNLAVALKGLGDLAGARRLEESIVDRWTALNGPDHPETLAARMNLAGTRYLQGELEAAHATYAELEERLALGSSAEDPVLLRVRSNLARTSAELGDLQRALELRESVHAVRSRILPPGHRELFHNLLGMAELHAKLGEPLRALEIRSQVHAALERSLPASHPERLAAASALASSLGEAGDRATELTLRREIVASLEAGHPDDPMLTRARYGLAMGLIEMGEPGVAQALLHEVRAHWIRLHGDEHDDVLDAEDGIATCMSALGNLDQALELKRSLLARRARDPRPNPFDLLRARVGVAQVLRRLGHHAEALDQLERAIEGARDLPPRNAQVLAARMELASALSAAGDVLAAHRLLEDVHAVQQERLPGEHPALLSVRANLVTLRLQLDDLQGAQDLAEALVAARERQAGGPDVGLHEARALLAQVLAVRGDHVRARELLEPVVDALAERLPPAHPNLVHAKLILSGVLKDTDPRRALELAHEVHADVAQRLPIEHNHRLVSAGRLAASYRRAGDYERALQVSQDVLAALDGVASGASADRLVALGNLAHTLDRLGEHEKLEAVTRELLRARIDFAGTLGVESPRLARGAALVQLQQLSRCLHWARHAAATEGEEPSRRLDELLFAALESLRAASTMAVEFANTSRDRPELAELRDGLALARSRLHDLGSTIPGEAGELEAWRARLRQLNDERDRIERELRALARDAGARAEALDVQALAARLGDSEAFASFFRYDRVTGRGQDGDNYRAEPSFLAFVVEPDATLRIVELGPAGDLERELDDWRASFGVGTSVRGLGIARDGDLELSNAIGSSLRRRVLDPLLEGMTDTKVLHVVLDDALHALPFEALPDGPGFLGDRLAIRRHSNALGLLRRGAARDRVASAHTLLLVGGVDYDAPPADPSLAGRQPTGGVAALGASNAFLPLSGSVRESAAIAHTFTKRFAKEPLLLEGSQATKERWRALAPGATHLHVATHGWFAPVPTHRSIEGRQDEDERRTADSITAYLPDVLCGLAFAGANRPADALGRQLGVLTAIELASLDLSSCELAVLSACETHLGLGRAGQGIHSLQRALLDAGARSAITSLWKVDDEATYELFDAFYRALWAEDLDPHEALERSRRVLRESGRAPRDWAAWVLTG